MNLLNVVHTNSFGTRKGGVPLMVEFRITPETAPFLVSATRSFTWVFPKRDIVRAAIRTFPAANGIESVFTDIVTTIATLGASAQWGNVHPFTKAGFAAAKEHLDYYDLKDTHTVTHPDTDVSGLGITGTVQRATWVPVGWAVVLPTDLDFVGFILIEGLKYLVVCHNASRAVAIVRP